MTNCGCFPGDEATPNAGALVACPGTVKTGLTHSVPLSLHLSDCRQNAGVHD